MKRPKIFSNRDLLTARDVVLENHLNEVCTYLALKSKDRQMVIELMHVVSIICTNIFKSRKTNKFRKNNEN